MQCVATIICKIDQLCELERSLTKKFEEIF